MKGNRLSIFQDPSGALFVQVFVDFFPPTPNVMKAHQLSPFKVPMAKIAGAKVPFAPGIFILFRSSLGSPAYIGRHDIRLYDAINEFAHHPQYKYFKFMRCHDAVDAYQWHCMFWHKGQSTIDNGGHHPNPPRGVEASCPYPGCNHTGTSEE